jgi:hypothetical protein
MSAVSRPPLICLYVSWPRFHVTVIRPQIPGAADQAIDQGRGGDDSGEAFLA